MLSALLATVLSAAPFPIELSGNAVLADEVYLALIELPEGAKPDDETVVLVHDQVEDFLRRSGYELANVVVTPSGDGLKVDIDEGRLEKIVFRGRFTFQMVRLKLALDLPREVFNKPQLERELAALSTQLGIDTPTWELVASEQVRHQGPQLTTLGPLNTLKGAALLHAQEKFELHLYFREREWSQGPGLDIRISYFDGLELGVNYQGRSLLFDDDRWRAGLMGGLGLRQDIPANVLYVFPSRLSAELQWFSPGLDEGKKVRPFIWLRGEGTGRQRKDLDLENYFLSNSELSLNVNMQINEPFSLSIGYGFQHLYLFGPQAPRGSPPAPAPVDPERIRNFFQLRSEYLFWAGNARWDRRHAVWLDGRVYSNYNRFDQLTFAEVRLYYQLVLPQGWNDVWIKVRGTWLTGDVLYTFEEPLGDHLRGVFGDIWVRTAASLRAEYRLSLSRDVFKLGVFTDVAAYGELDRLTNAQTPRFGVAFGPSFNTLIEGMFQLDMQLSFGIVSTGRFNTGVNATLVKVF